MFDFRYHALSLAAVLIALAVGVLLGVAIGDTNLVSSAKSGIVNNLRHDLDAARAQSAELRAQVAAETTVENQLLPFAVAGQLAGKNIGLIFLGGSSDQVGGLVRGAITSAGGRVSLVGVVREPLDLGALAQAAVGTRYANLGSDPTLVSSFGRRVGAQLVPGGPFLARLRTSLLSSFTGQLGRLQGVVLYRDDPTTLNAQQATAEAAFESGLLSGVVSTAAPVVGVELTTAAPSQIPWYKGAHVSSVDDLDTVTGRTALALALAGNHGTFGTKSTADSVLPPLTQTASATGTP